MEGFIDGGVVGCGDIIGGDAVKTRERGDGELSEGVGYLLWRDKWVNKYNLIKWHMLVFANSYIKSKTN